MIKLPVILFMGTILIFHLAGLPGIAADMIVLRMCRDLIKRTVAIISDSARENHSLLIAAVKRAWQPPRASTRTGDRNHTCRPQGPCARRRG